MTLNEFLDWMDAVRPSPWSHEQKTAWVNDLESALWGQIFLAPMGRWKSKTAAEDGDKPLLLPDGWRKLYAAYLGAMMDFAAGEYSQYANSMALYNGHLAELGAWYAERFDPARRPPMWLQLPAVTGGALEDGTVYLGRLPAGAAVLAAECRVTEDFDGEGDIALGSGEEPAVYLTVTGESGPARRLTLNLPPEDREVYLTGPKGVSRGRMELRLLIQPGLESALAPGAAALQSGASSSGGISAGGIGSDGESAYEIAVENGFKGTEAEWLESLAGVCVEEIHLYKDGVSGEEGGGFGVGIASVEQTTTSATDGGKNVVTVKLTDGTTSTFTVKNGSKGSAGAAGLSAYEIAVANGFEGDEDAWLESLKGTGTGSGSGAAGEDGVGIESVVQDYTSTEDGGDNVIKITLTNGEEYFFSVKNGSRGSTGAAGADGEDGECLAVVGAGAPNSDPIYSQGTLYYDMENSTLYVCTEELWQEGTMMAVEWKAVSGAGTGGEDGVGIESVVQDYTSTEDGGDNVIKITLTNGEEYFFSVKNGSRGSTGAAGADGEDGECLAVVGTGAPNSDPIYSQGTLYYDAENSTLYVCTEELWQEGTMMAVEWKAVSGVGTGGEDGVGIASVEQTTGSSKDDGYNVVTVTLTDGTTSTFTVKNGSKGSTGAQGEAGKSAYAYAQEGGYTGTEEEFAALIAGNAPADYIVSAGSSGDWSWQKYASGTVKAWCMVNISDVDCTTALGETGFYCTGDINVAFPEDVFLSGAGANLDFSFNGTAYGTSAFVYQSSGNIPNGSTIALKLVRHVSCTLGGIISVQAIGKWK